MSTRGHRNVLSGLVSAVFGARIFRKRWVRWPLAALIAGLAVHTITSGAAVEGQDKSAVIPAILFLFAIFLIVLPALPIADAWADKDPRD